MALPQMTTQQHADLILRYWQELRALPHDAREARLNEMLLEFESACYSILANPRGLGSK